MLIVKDESTLGFENDSSSLWIPAKYGCSRALSSHKRSFGSIFNKAFMKSKAGRGILPAYFKSRVSGLDKSGKLSP